MHFGISVQECTDGAKALKLCPLPEYPEEIEDERDVDALNELVRAIGLECGRYAGMNAVVAPDEAIGSVLRSLMPTAAEQLSELEVNELHASLPHVFPSEMTSLSKSLARVREQQTWQVPITIH